jgi:hypothetical protein
MRLTQLWRQLRHNLEIAKFFNKTYHLTNIINIK